jgi:hypothetical protein
MKARPQFLLTQRHLGTRLDNVQEIHLTWWWIEKLLRISEIKPAACLLISLHQNWEDYDESSSLHEITNSKWDFEKLMQKRRRGRQVCRLKGTIKTGRKEMKSVIMCLGINLIRIGSNGDTFYAMMDLLVAQQWGESKLTGSLQKCKPTHTEEKQVKKSYLQLHDSGYFIKLISLQIRFTNLMFFWPCITVYQYNKTNVMHFSFNFIKN